MSFFYKTGICRHLMAKFRWISSGILYTYSAFCFSFNSLFVFYSSFCSSVNSPYTSVVSSCGLHSCACSRNLSRVSTKSVSSFFDKFRNSSRFDWAKLRQLVASSWAEARRMSLWMNFQIAPMTLITWLMPAKLGLHSGLVDWTSLEKPEGSSCCRTRAR